MYFYNIVLQSCIFPVYIFIRSIKSQYIAPSLALQKTYTKKELFTIPTCIFCSQNKLKTLKYTQFLFAKTYSAVLFSVWAPALMVNQKQQCQALALIHTFCVKHSNIGSACFMYRVLQNPRQTLKRPQLAMWGIFNLFSQIPCLVECFIIYQDINEHAGRRNEKFKMLRIFNMYSSRVCLDGGWGVCVTKTHNTQPRMEPDLTHSLCEVGLVPWACLMVMNYCQATLLRDGLLREEIALLSIKP